MSDGPLAVASYWLHAGRIARWSVPARRRSWTMEDLSLRHLVRIWP